MAGTRSCFAGCGKKKTPLVSLLVYTSSLSHVSSKFLLHFIIISIFVPFFVDVINGPLIVLGHGAVIILAILSL